MKVAIIGAAGFIGTKLATHYVNAGHQVLSIDVARRKRLGTGESYLNADVVRQAPSIGPLTDAVFYLAQSPHAQAFPRNGDELFAVNTMGAIRTAYAALKAGARFFCYASSADVYAPSLHPMTENHDLRRNDPYALSKIHAEEAVQLFRGYMAVTSVRPFSVFGPGQTGALPARLMEMVQQGRPIRLEPCQEQERDGDGVRVSYTFVEDLVQWLADLAEKAGSGMNIPPTINLAGAEVVSMRTFAETVGEAIGKKPVFEQAHSTGRSHLIADTSLMRSVIDPHYTEFMDAVTRTLK